MEFIHHHEKPPTGIHGKTGPYNLLSHKKIAAGAALRTTSLQRRTKVLVIDSNKDALLINKVLLSCLGYSVLSAASSNEAIGVFQRNTTDIRFVLSDFGIPHLNGMEILQELRKIVPGIPMILSSGYIEEYVVGEDFRERPTCFLKKPYDFLALKHAVHLTLDRST